MVASANLPERHVTPRLILEVFGVSLLLFASYVVFQNTGLANSGQILSGLALFLLYFALMLFVTALILTAIYYALR